MEKIVVNKDLVSLSLSNIKTGVISVSAPKLVAVKENNSVQTVLSQSNTRPEVISVKAPATAGVKPSMPVFPVAPAEPIKTNTPTQNVVSTPITKSEPIKEVVPEMYIKETPQAKNVSFTAVVSDEIGTIPGANVNVNGIFYTPTDIYGKFSLKNIESNAIVSISFVGYKTKQYQASQVPAKITLEQDNNNLNEVVVKNNYKKPNYWWIVAVIGVTIGGYYYTRDPKTNKIIKTKI